MAKFVAHKEKTGYFRMFHQAFTTNFLICWPHTTRERLVMILNFCCLAFLFLIRKIDGRNEPSLTLSPGYGCLLKCMAQCMSESEEQIRDCKIKCQKRSNKKQCAEKQDECDDICKNIREGNLSQDDSLTPLILSFKDEHQNSKFTEFVWNTVPGAKLYVVSVKPENGSTIFQEVRDDNFILVKPRICTLYEIRVAYILRNDEADLVLSPFSRSVVIDSLPKFLEPISPKPAQLVLEKTPYFDETTRQKLDDSTIFLRHKVKLPVGWSSEDFRFVGKYWRVQDCKNFPSDKPPIVTFSRIVRKGAENFVEAKFPAYLGRSKCTVMNQLKTIDVCDQILPFPFDSKDKMFRVILEVHLNQNEQCAGSIHISAVI